VTSQPDLQREVVLLVGPIMKMWIVLFRLPNDYEKRTKANLKVSLQFLEWIFTSKSVSLDFLHNQERLLTSLVVTGEEDEDTVFSIRAKLYVLSDQQVWKERGTGTLKVNVQKEGDGARLGLLFLIEVNLCSFFVYQ
jgi:RanBP1 domain